MRASRLVSAVRQAAQRCLQPAPLSVLDEELRSGVRLTLQHALLQREYVVVARVRHHQRCIKFIATAFARVDPARLHDVLRFVARANERLTFGFLAVDQESYEVRLYMNVPYDGVQNDQLALVFGKALCFMRDTYERLLPLIDTHTERLQRQRRQSHNDVGDDDDDDDDDLDVSDVSTESDRDESESDEATLCAKMMYDAALAALDTRFFRLVSVDERNFRIVVKCSGGGGGGGGSGGGRSSIVLLVSVDGAARTVQVAAVLRSGVQPHIFEAVERLVQRLNTRIDDGNTRVELDLGRREVRLVSELLLLCGGGVEDEEEDEEELRERLLPQLFERAFALADTLGPELDACATTTTTTTTASTGTEAGCEFEDVLERIRQDLQLHDAA